MIYPKFLIKGNTIGITAVSAGMGSRIDEYLDSISVLKKDYNIVETSNVRSNSYVSSSSEDRVSELDSLYTNKDINMIMCATGGDFCLEMLDKINFDLIKNNPKWIMGASDPTSILYTITTKLDIATIYGLNASSYSSDLHECLKNNLEILKGNFVRQDSFKYFDSNPGWGEHKLDGEVYWESNKDINIKGRIIGGCFDVLLNLIGTPYDYTKEFIERYKDDGIIWYFDNFAKNSCDFYLGLLQMKMAGWFKYTKGIIVGRVKYPNISYDDFNYYDALEKIFKDIPIINNADIGHVFPKMTIINGSLATIKCSDGKGSIEMELK